MKETLLNKLHEYIRENNPELLLQLEQDSTVTKYLSDKISTVDGNEEACMDQLTQDLRPSKYNYICNILEEEFERLYLQLKVSGLLQFEIINMMGHCQPFFAELNFNEENEDNRFLRYAIISEIENVSHGLQQSAKI